MVLEASLLRLLETLIMSIDLSRLFFDEVRKAQLLGPRRGSFLGGLVVTKEFFFFCKKIVVLEFPALLGNFLALGWR